MRLFKRPAEVGYFGVCSTETGWYIEPDFDSSYKEVKANKGWCDEDFYNAQEKMILASDSMFEWED